MRKRFFLFIATILLGGSIIAQEQPQHYTFDAHLYPNNLQVVAQIKIDNIITNSNNIELGAFINGTVRGSKRITESEGYYRAWIQVYDDVDEEFGEDVTFKIYDHDAGVEYTYYTPVNVTVRMKAWGDAVNPVVLSFYHTFTKDITAYSGNNGWYLIASPLAASTSPNAVTNMISNNYDLYYFDQTGGSNGKEWKNWKPESGNDNPNFNLVPGQGYLYANNTTTTLTFIGAPNEASVVTLTRGTNNNHHDLEGWNLIGNSSDSYATIGTRSYYCMNAARTNITVGDGTIEPMGGIFVYYDPDAEEGDPNKSNTVTFTKTAAPSKRTIEEDRVALNLSRNNSDAIDRVLVRFDEGGTLPKYSMRDNECVIYIPQADKDYAVVKGSATNVFPVNFKTEDFGTYTLSADIAGANVDYMHLIDKITGEDVDMLLESEYSFVAAPVDREDRFILRLTYSGYFDNESDIFAYQNGSDIVVCGEGTLQVFDVMGRFVTSYEVNGVQSIQAMPMGVYIFRMLGDDVKTQKIYVR